MSGARSVPQVFISYSRDDAAWLDEFKRMLKVYVRRREFSVWDDTLIAPSAEWKTDIEKAIGESQVALLLVSPGFLASDFITEVELPALLKRVTAKELTLLWVPLSSCAYRGTEIDRYQAVHDPGQPLDRLSLAERNFALTEICERVKAAVFQLRQSIIPHDDLEPPTPNDLPEVSSRHYRGPSNAAPKNLRSAAAADLEYQMLFGALAVQMDLIASEQLTEALISWSTRRTLSIAEQMMERRWLELDDRRAIDRLIKNKLQKHHGDLPSTLAAVADSTLREAMRASGVPDIRDSLDALPEEELQDKASPAGSTPRYEWVRLHREGPLGQIWLARDLDLERDAALKTVAPDRATDPRAIRRFQREAQIAAKLEHPNIVPVYELAQRSPNGQPFYAMRFLRGKTLSNVIAEYHQNCRDGRGDVRERRRMLGMFVSVCNAVAYAHSRHILHRDLKPDNVALGDFGEVYLLDWGLAKEFEPASTSAAENRVPPPPVAFTAGVRGPGSPAYMSPEQAANRTDLMDTRTDVYGLGAILFEMLVGKPPHGEAGQSVDEVLRRIIEEEPPSPRVIEASVPPPLDQICAKAIARHSVDRFATAQEIGAAIQLWLDEEPLSAYRANVKWFEKLLGESPDERSYREGLAKSLVVLGLVLSGVDRQFDAEQVYRRSIAEYEKLLSQSPKVIRYRADLAACRLHLRSNLKAQGRDGDAEMVHRQAIEDYEALIRDEPSDKQAWLGATLTLLPLSPSQQNQLAQTGPEEAPLGGVVDASAPTVVDERAPAQVSRGSISVLHPIDEFATVSPEAHERTTEFGAPIKGPRYRILRPLSSGSLGQVHLAYDEALKREVALKSSGRGLLMMSAPASVFYGRPGSHLDWTIRGLSRFTV
jgi:serine/threonine protein kinase